MKIHAEINVKIREEIQVNLTLKFSKKTKRNNEKRHFQILVEFHVEINTKVYVKNQFKLIA